MQTRRAVLGDEHVDRALAATTEFDRPFQERIVEQVWNDLWSSEGLDLRSRHLVTIAILAALGREHELTLHLRSIGRTGVVPEEVQQVLLHVAAYAGVPAANEAFAAAKRALSNSTTETE